MPVFSGAENFTPPLVTVKQRKAQQNLVKKQPYDTAQRDGGDQQYLPAGSVFLGDVSHAQHKDEQRIEEAVEDTAQGKSEAGLG